MSNAEHKRLLKQRKTFDSVFARHDLTPIGELNFDTYSTLAKKPPSGNLRLSRMFFAELERRGRELAQRAGRELGSLTTHFQVQIAGEMTGETSWKSVRDYGRSYILVVDYWSRDNVALTETRRLLATPLYEEYNTLFIKPLGLPENYELSDFLVFRHPAVPPEVWSPLTISAYSLSVEDLVEVKNWV